MTTLLASDAAITYADVAPGDAAELSAMAAASFTESFGHAYSAENLRLFLDRAYGPHGLPAHVVDPAYRIRLARAEGRIVGYAKLGPILFPGEWQDASVALHQLYVLSPFHGGGVADTLMRWAIAAAREGGAEALILSVWAENLRAQAFYRRRGFEEIGRYDFVVGDHVDDDRIMRLPL